MYDKKKIFIDIGHGGRETGATSITGEYEKDINLQVGMYLKELLQRHNDIFEFELSRTSDSYVSLFDRVDRANKLDVDLMISIHHNAGGGEGAETIHTIYGGEGKEFANTLAKEYSKYTSIRRVFSRESLVHRNKDYYYVIKYTKMPCVISEYAFLDTLDFYNIDTEDERRQQAQAIFNSILKHFGIRLSKINTLRNDIKYLQSFDIINSPEYWLKELRKDTISTKNVKILINNMSEYLHKLY